MSTDENKDIARRFMQAWGTADLTIVDELAAPNFTVTYPYFNATHQKDTLEDLDEFKQAILAFHSEMSDIMLVSEDDIIAEDDKVVICWTASAAYKQDSFGFTNGSIVGKSVVWSGISIFRIVDGKVVQETGHEDFSAALRQLGIAPTGWMLRELTA